METMATSSVLLTLAAVLGLASGAADAARTEDLPRYHGAVSLRGQALESAPGLSHGTITGRFPFEVMAGPLDEGRKY